MKSACIILAGLIAMVAGQAWGQATQPTVEQALSAVRTQTPYFGAYTFTNPRPVALGTLNQPSQLNCPVIVVQQPPPGPSVAQRLSDEPLLPTATLNYQPPAMATSEIYQLQPIVPVQGFYGQYANPHRIAAPEVRMVEPQYPVARPFFAPSPLPYGYVGVSPLFNQTSTRVIIQP